jgi:hypothetical protein
LISHHEELQALIFPKQLMADLTDQRQWMSHTWLGRWTSSNCWWICKTIDTLGLPMDVPMGKRMNGRRLEGWVVQCRRC